MARGENTAHHPNRKVGRDRNDYGYTDIHSLTKDATGYQVGMDWATGDHESYPLDQLVHDDESSPYYGKQVRIKHLKETAKKAKGQYAESSMERIQVARKDS